MQPFESQKAKFGGDVLLHGQPSEGIGREATVSSGRICVIHMPDVRRHLESTADNQVDTSEDRRRGSCNSR